MSLDFELTASEKITMLLDGELSTDEAGKLFFDVSQDENLQEEFVSQLKVRKYMAPALITPSDTLKAGIIASLGLTEFATGTVATLGTMARFTNGVKTFVAGKAFLAFLATSLGALGTFFLMDNNKPQTETKYVTKEVPVYKYINQPVANAAIAHNSGAGINRRNSYPMSISNEVVQDKNENTPISPITETKESNIDLVSNREQNPPQLTILNENKNSNDVHLQEVHSPELKNTITSNNDKIIVPNSEVFKQKQISAENSRFALSFRGFATQNIGTDYLPAQNTPAINNVAMGIYYDFNKNFYAGLEFGQENFMQNFKARSGNSEIDILQNRLAFWGGLSASYRLDKTDYLAGLQPYGNIFLGATNFGYINRASTGLYLDIAPQFAMFSGFEFTTLFSSYNNIWQTSNKYGMTYGILIRF